MVICYTTKENINHYTTDLITLTDSPRSTHMRRYGMRSTKKMMFLHLMLKEKSVLFVAMPY